MTIQLAAYWGLGGAALTVAVVLLIGYLLRSSRAFALTGQLLIAASVLFLVIGLTLRALQGHGWPFVSWTDTAAGIAILMLLIYLVWSIAAHTPSTGGIVALIALGLILLDVSQQTTAPVTLSIRQLNVVISNSATIWGGAFLGLSAATGLSGLARRALKARFGQGAWISAQLAARWGEIWVRCGLFFLAASLAVDVWWVQQLDLSLTNNAQQAGIAVAWMIYFVALRLKNQPRWQGWPWDTIQVIGFACTLPILLDVPWLNQSLI
ncbi:MAG: hypothetical protein JW934_02965 [Anaerolineae bacterium]|nr:hypothetical protein [Anaerolineae bacterium]